MREEASVAYLRRYASGLLHWLSTRPAFANEGDRRNLERDAAQAMRLYERL